MEISVSENKRVRKSAYVTNWFEFFLHGRGKDYWPTAGSTIFSFDLGAFSPIPVFYDKKESREVVCSERLRGLFWQK